MSRRHVEQALRRATARDRKRAPRMKVSGVGVFALQKLFRKKR
jgi:hypothetical protein